MKQLNAFQLQSVSAADASVALSVAVSLDRNEYDWKKNLAISTLLGAAVGIPLIYENPALLNRELGIAFLGAAVGLMIQYS